MFLRLSAAGVSDGFDVPYDLVLEFPKLSPDECAGAPTTGPTAGLVVVTKQIILGSIARAAGKESSPVVFDVVIPPASASLFAVDVAKGSVAPGATQKVSCFASSFARFVFREHSPQHVSVAALCLCFGI